MSSKTKECPDCNGTGREQMPCDPDEVNCEFCGGTGAMRHQEPAMSSDSDVWQFRNGFGRWVYCGALRAASQADWGLPVRLVTNPILPCVLPEGFTAEEKESK